MSLLLLSKFFFSFILISFQVSWADYFDNYRPFNSKTIDVFKNRLGNQYLITEDQSGVGLSLEIDVKKHTLARHSIDLRTAAFCLKISDAGKLESFLEIGKSPIRPEDRNVIMVLLPKETKPNPFSPVEWLRLSDFCESKRSIYSWLDELSSFGPFSVITFTYYPLTPSALRMFDVPVPIYPSEKMGESSTNQHGKTLSKL